MSSPKQVRTPLQDWISLTNKIRIDAAFKRIITLGDAYNRIGIPCPVDPATPYTNAQFNLLIKPLEEKIKLTGSLVDKVILTSVEDIVEDWDKEVKQWIPKRNPAQQASLIKFQPRCARYIFWLICKNERGALLRLKAGMGKTFIIFQVLRWLEDINWYKGKTHSPYKCIILEPASVVEQTTRVGEDLFGLKPFRDFWCTNYDALRSSFGRNSVIQEDTVIEQGEPKLRITWKPFLEPLILVPDEYQKVKNLDSKQSQIIQAYNDCINKHTFVLSSSATPFSKVDSAKVFCVSTHLKYDFLGREETLTNDNWSRFSKRLCGEVPPEGFSKANIKRLIKTFHKYIVTARNVHLDFHSHNGLMYIDFETEEERQAYEVAWENYLKAKAEIEGSDAANSPFLILVQFLKFRQAAELIRARSLAKLMFNSMQEGMAPIAAMCFKPSIAKCVNYLYQDYNIQRSQISLIWGGDARFGGGEHVSKEDIQKLVTEAMEGACLDQRRIKKIISQMQADTMGLTDLPKELDLGIQTKEKRQYEIDKFQSGKSLFCFFTFQAGGAGLSLHHCDTGNRQRRTFLTPTYNEMEMEQGFGRAHRINSLSDTIQSIILYRGTIEERVLARMTQKKTCLDVISNFSMDDPESMKILSMTAADDERVNEAEYEEIENET